VAGFLAALWATDAPVGPFGREFDVGGGGAPGQCRYLEYGCDASISFDRAGGWLDEAGESGEQR
jgi:hypothetical protein